MDMVEKRDGWGDGGGQEGGVLTTSERREELEGRASGEWLRWVRVLGGCLLDWASVSGVKWTERRGGRGEGGKRGSSTKDGGHALVSLPVWTSTS